MARACVFVALLGSAASTTEIPSIYERRPETDATDLTCAERAAGSVYLPGLFPFTGATAGTDIADGGYDMYDHGTVLRLQVGGVWTKPLKYTQVCHRGEGEPAGRGDAEYNTCMLPNGSPLFVAAFSSAESAITGFRIDGNLGADGGGSMSSTSLPLTSVVNKALFPPSPPPPSPTPAPPGFTCVNTCNYASDGDCDDGGSGNEYGICSPCTDCEGT
jgi:hypothetical protein